jgi:uncharacterized CHY-type Zn-finger protein
MNKYRTKQLEKMNNYFKQINHLSPFPVIDTDIIKDIDHQIKHDKVDYDDEPVICCAHCKSLAIYTDEYENDTCPLCTNSLNETETHPTIFHYLNKYKDRW